MRVLLMILLAPVLSQAFISQSEFLAANDVASETETATEAAQKRTLICAKLSASSCFGRLVGDACLENAQKGQTGFCRSRSRLYDHDLVTCQCSN